MVFRLSIRGPQAFAGRSDRRLEVFDIPARIQENGPQGLSFNQERAAVSEFDLESHVASEIEWNRDLVSQQPFIELKTAVPKRNRKLLRKRSVLSRVEPELRDVSPSSSGVAPGDAGGVMHVGV